MKKAKFYLTLSVGSDTANFIAILHPIRNQSQLNLHPRKFYQAHYPAKIPAGPHYELELLYFFYNDDEIVITDRLTDFHLQIARKKQKIFLGWPKRISNRLQAQRVLIAWAVGIISVFKSGSDFYPKILDAADLNDFINKISRIYQIKIKELQEMSPH